MNKLILLIALLPFVVSAKPNLILAYQTNANPDTTVMAVPERSGTKYTITTKSGCTHTVDATQLTKYTNYITVHDYLVFYDSAMIDCNKTWVCENHNVTLTVDNPYAIYYAVITFECYPQ